MLSADHTRESAIFEPISGVYELKLVSLCFNREYEATHLILKKR